MALDARLNRHVLRSVYTSPAAPPRRQRLVLSGAVAPDHGMQVARRAGGSSVHDSGGAEPGSGRNQMRFPH
jgi:hypothetical protein